MLLPTSGRPQSIRQVPVTKYTETDGLSNYFITKIIKDSYGFIWIGTQEGLNLFDGKHFEVFSSQSPPRHRLAGTLISDLVEDRKRSLLWVLSSYGGLCALDLKTRTIIKRIVSDPDGNPISDTWLRCLQIQGDTLWIGGHGSLWAYDILKDQYIHTDLRKKSRVGSGEFNIARILFDQHRRMWLASEGFGIIVLDKHSEFITSFTDALHGDRQQHRKLLFLELLQAKDKVYAATSWGLRVFDVTSSGFHLSKKKNHDILDHAEIQAMTLGGDGSLMFSTPERFYTFDLTSQRLQAYQEEGGDENGLAQVFQVLCDTASQTVWLGTQGGLSTFSLRESPFQAFNRSSNSPVKLKHLYAVLPTAEDEIWAGDENALFHINTRTREIQCVDTTGGTYLLFRDTGNNIYVSNKGGLKVLRNKALVPVHRIFPYMKPLENDHLSCAVQYNDSIMLFGSVIQKGLWVCDVKSQRLRVFHNDSARSRIAGLSIINFLFRGNNRDVFILTEKSIIRFHPITGTYNVIRITAADGKIVTDNFMDMCETPSGYWIATYGNGVLETDRSFRVINHFTVGSGLSNNCVYRIFSWQNKFIIGTTNKGLFTIDTHHRKVKNYFEEDGLHGNGFEQLCGSQAGDKIYAGGAKGFTAITPSNLFSNQVPPSLFFGKIKIESVSGITDTCNLALKKIIVPHDALQTSVHLSALNYRNPNRVGYSYKIDEVGNEWINLENRNFINLIGLKPGVYTLQVRASNEDGITTAPLALTMEFLPKWFQTLAFKLAAIGLCLAMVALFLRYRITQFKKQQAIRKEIANDLHDDLGSTLNTLKIFTHLAKMNPGNKEYLDQIEDSITNASTSLRDMIWVLDDSDDTYPEVMERIKKKFSPVCLAKDIQLVSKIECDITQPISKTEKRNLLLIAKESVNNSIKYSNCKNICVRLSQTGHETRFSIEDDGIGFDVSGISPGRGLGSMQYRAKQINYNMEIVSAPASGTRIILKK